MNRRGFLRALIALPPVLALARLIPSSVRPRVVSDTLNDIIAATIESRSRQIADNVSRNNVLLMRLTRPAEYAEHMKPANRCRRRIEWRRAHPVQGGYASWRGAA